VNKVTNAMLAGSIDLTSKVIGVLPVTNGGTGQSTFINGQLLIGNTTGNTLNKATLSGTTNQVSVLNGPGSITLSLPQSIAPTSDVTFNSLTLSEVVNTPAISFGYNTSMRVKNGTNAYEGFLIPRAADDKTYLTYGSNGLVFRNPSNAEFLSINNQGIVELAGVIPADDNSTRVATTAFVKNSATLDATSSATGKIRLAGDLGGVGSTAAEPKITAAAVLDKTLTNINTTTTGSVSATDTVLGAFGKLQATKAPLDSPTFTGTPSLPTGTTGETQATTDSSTKLATTAFVNAAIPNATVTVPGKIQLAGDLSGSATAPIVNKIQGITVSATAPTNGQLLQYNSTTSSWTPVAINTVVRRGVTEITATASQSVFTLSNIPLSGSLVSMFINGVRIANAAHSISVNNLTYIPANNFSYTIEDSDIVTFEYIY
jgi:hypothetical protein